jgi:uncharacterized protein
LFVVHTSGMATRTGSADLPLHGGRVPLWLATRMASLGRVIVEAVVHHYGRDEILRRLAHPFWFQAFGAVMGMDWHSSGITTSVMGALKRGLQPVQSELGLYVCGGRGRHSRRTPAEIAQVGERTGLDAAPLARASRLVAKVDSAAVQDGFNLYLHAFVVGADGHWCVVQQGMNAPRREARRYHWLSENMQSFLDSPHAAIEGRNQGNIVNLTDARAARSRQTALELVRAGPDRTIAVLRRLRGGDNATLSLFPSKLETESQAGEPLPDAQLRPHLQMPAHHDVRSSDVMLKRLHGTLAAAAERGPEDFTELLLSPGVGARTIASLAFVAEIVHGAPARFSDPARFSLAHGGKDGQPFPVPLRVYDETIRVLKSAVDRAKLGNADRLAAIERLDVQARALERLATGPQFTAHVDGEWARSHEYGGRAVKQRY